MAMKTCPDCGAEVPAAAARCKECFHDFNEQKVTRTGPIVLLAALAAMSLMAALTFWLISMRPIEQHILVDERTESVVFTTQYRNGPETDRLLFAEIASLQHVTTAAGKYEVVAITLSGERKTIQSDAKRSLRGEAEHYAAMMEKPLVMVDNTRGFHKMAEEEK